MALEGLAGSRATGNGSKMTLVSTAEWVRKVKKR